MLHNLAGLPGLMCGVVARCMILVIHVCIYNPGREFLSNGNEKLSHYGGLYSKPRWHDG